MTIPSAEKTSPPPSLTGGVCTVSAEISVDWFSCTWAIPDEESVEGMVHTVLGWLAWCVDSQELAERGKFGYSRSMWLNGKALLMWNPDHPKMGVHLSIPSSAFPTMLGAEDRPEDLIHYLVETCGARPTRVDVAFDDYTGTLDMAVIAGAYDRLEFSTRWRTSMLQFRARCQDGEPLGKMLTFGRRDSESYLRIYDKKLEQECKKIDVPHEHWIRCELEFKAEKAIAVTSELFKENAGVRLMGLLLGYLDWKTPDSMDSNKRRWPSAPWWIAFLSNVAKCRLTLPCPDKTVERAGKWIEQQTSPSLAMCALAFGGDDIASAVAWIQDLVEDGIQRFDSEHERALKEWRKTNKPPERTKSVMRCNPAGQPACKRILWSTV